MLLGTIHLDWGFVHLEFIGFDHKPRALDFTIGLSKAKLSMHKAGDLHISLSLESTFSAISAGHLVIEEEKPVTDMATSLGHLPVVRQHVHFERAGLACRITLWLSQAYTLNNPVNPVIGGLCDRLHSLPQFSV